mmetsp:Transcript_12397/g.31450  ORF Transcript_12397/g.31450 Transcript_12397/m.31450 type:complete len:262 (+) Transcript_12397:1056-1841(+)
MARKSSEARRVSSDATSLGSWLRRVRLRISSWWSGQFFSRNMLATERGSNPISMCMFLRGQLGFVTSVVARRFPELRDRFFPDRFRRGEADPTDGMSGSDRAASVRSWKEDGVKEIARCARPAKVVRSEKETDDSSMPSVDPFRSFLRVFLRLLLSALRCLAMMGPARLSISTSDPAESAFTTGFVASGGTAPAENDTVRSLRVPASASATAASGAGGRKATGLGLVDDRTRRGGCGTLGRERVVLGLPPPALVFVLVLTI